MKTVRNHISLIGNLGRDPETKETSNGKKLSKFSLATNRTYKNSEGEFITDTTWHNAIAWGYLADRVQKSLKKGYLVVVEGTQSNRSYEDQEGKKRYVSEVIIRDFQHLGKKNQEPVKADSEEMPF